MLRSSLLVGVWGHQRTAQQLSSGVGVDRLRKQETLHCSTAHFLQQMQLVRRLHTFCNDVESERQANVENDPNELCRSRIRAQIADEGPIDLQCLYGEDVQGLQ